jgi:hypothetical protein
MLPWIERPTIDVDLDRAIDLSYRDTHPEALAASRELLGFIRTEIPSAARYLAYLVRLRTANRFHREIASLARLVDADWRDVMLANVSYDFVVAQFGCSTVALPSPDGPVVARNMDWAPEDLLARASYLIRCNSGAALRFFNAGWPGATGIVTGLSARGFAVILNAVSCTEKVCKTGYPVLLHLRRVVEDAHDFDSALQMLSTQRLTSPALFTLVGVTNEQRVVIERTPTKHALRWGKPNEPLLTTNHYRLMCQSDGDGYSPNNQTSCSRFDALCSFFANYKADRTLGDEELLYILSDPKVIQGITAQHVILRPRSSQVRLFVPRRFLAPDQF